MSPTPMSAVAPAAATCVLCHAVPILSYFFPCTLPPWFRFLHHVFVVFAPLPRAWRVIPCLLSWLAPQGATQPLLFDFSMTEGCRAESAYEYTATTGTCVEDEYPKVATVEGYGILPENCNEATLKAFLLAHGPIAVSVDASKWSSYSSGVLSYR